MSLSGNIAELAWREAYTTKRMVPSSVLNHLLIEASSDCLQPPLKIQIHWSNTLNLFFKMLITKKNSTRLAVLNLVFSLASAKPTNQFEKFTISNGESSSIIFFKSAFRAVSGSIPPGYEIFRIQLRSRHKQTHRWQGLLSRFELQ